MKYQLYLIFFSVCWVSCQMVNERFKLSAVTSGNIAAILYNEVRNNDSGIQEPEGLSFNDKNEICRYIIGSNYYKYVSGGVLVNKDHPMYNKLLEKNNGIEAIGLIKTQLTLQEVFHFNPTIPVKAFPDRGNDQPFSENIFSCVTFDPTFSKESVFLYYVSPEYNLNDSHHPPIKGRFIFNLQSDENVLEVSSFAEEPAEPVSEVGAKAERLYLENRAGHKPTISSSDDPLCSLTQEERIHACTKVLSSFYFEKEKHYNYAPPHDPSDSECDDDDSDSDEPSIVDKSGLARSIEFFMNQPISKRVYKLAEDLSKLILDKLRKKSANEPAVGGLTELINANETTDDSATAKPTEESVDEPTEKLGEEPVIKHEDEPIENLHDKPVEKSVVTKSMESVRKFGQPIHKLADDLANLILQNLTRKPDNKSNADELKSEGGSATGKSEEKIDDYVVVEPSDISESSEESDEESVEEPCECVKNRIIFQDKEVQQQQEVREGKWEEWMIRCKSSVPNETEFFLSRAYNSDHQVFAYRLHEDNDSILIDNDPEINSTVVVENMFGDIRLKIQN